MQFPRIKMLYHVEHQHTVKVGSWEWQFLSVGLCYASLAGGLRHIVNNILRHLHCHHRVIDPISICAETRTVTQNFAATTAHVQYFHAWFYCCQRKRRVQTPG